MLPKGFLGPVASCSVRSPEHATRSEGLRKRVSGARLRRRPTSAQGPRREADGGRSLGRSVAGRLGQTGRLGLARPGVGEQRSPEKGTPSLSELGSSTPGRARRLQAASAERIAGGALARGGLRVPVGLCVCCDSAHGGSLHRGLSPRFSVRVGCALSGFASLCPRQPPAGSYIRDRKSWTLAVEKISQEGARERAQHLLGWEGTSRVPERPALGRRGPERRPLT